MTTRARNTPDPRAGGSCGSIAPLRAATHGWTKYRPPTTNRNPTIEIQRSQCSKSREGNSMSEGKNRQWILEARPTGKLTGNEFRWNEASIPQPADGQVLVRNLWLSFDPTQRGWMSRDTYMPMVPLGEVMRASGVGQVIEFRHPNFKAGDLVQGGLGWQDYVATDGKGFVGLRKLPPGVAAQSRAEPVRHHWYDRLFRHNRDRPDQSRRDGRGVGRGRQHRLRLPDRSQRSKAAA